MLQKMEKCRTATDTVPFLNNFKKRFTSSLFMVLRFFVSIKTCYCVVYLSLFNSGNSKLVGSGGGNAEHRLATRLCPEKPDWSVLIDLWSITCALQIFCWTLQWLLVCICFSPQDCFLLLWRWSQLSDTLRAGWSAQCSTATSAWGSWWYSAQSSLTRLKTCCWRCWRTWRQVCTDRSSLWMGLCVYFEGSSLQKCVLFTGTESETKAFMAVCIETAKRYNLDDYRTPVFIFERLCSIIYPVSATSQISLTALLP